MRGRREKDGAGKRKEKERRGKAEKRERKKSDRREEKIKEREMWIGGRTRKREIGRGEKESGRM